MKYELKVRVASRYRLNHFDRTFCQLLLTVPVASPLRSGGKDDGVDASEKS